MRREINWRSIGRAAMPVLATAAMSNCLAFEIDTGNPDLSVRWDNTLRYNLGVRAQRQDMAQTNAIGHANSDLKFGRGDVITSRFDLLSEVDVIYKDRLGLRVSGQGWYDPAYDDKEEINPALGPASAAYPNQRFTDFTKRWNEGPSAEFLDYFVFGKFSVGNVETNLRLGSHNLYWGESLFSFVHGVSYAQGPVDVRKALATPGTEAKELFKPLRQMSFTTQLSDTFSVAGQYFLDWKPSTLPDGGTYFGLADFITAGGGTTVGAFGGLPFVGTNHEPDKKHGDWGLMARWSPAWLSGTAGLYYREYTDKFPQIVPAADFSNLGFDYLDKRVTLVGASLSKNIAGIVVSGEVAHRKNTGLLAGPAATIGTEPVGDTWHALVNLVGYVGKTALFDSMVWLGELTYSRLDKVRSNPGSFNSVDYACAGVAANLGCATKDAVGIALKVEPKWTQVFDGVDLSMPVFYTVGLKGNSPVFFGGYKGDGSYSIGLTADYLNKHNFSLSYNGFLARKTRADVSGMRVVADATSYFYDRGNVTFTFKTSF